MNGLVEEEESSMSPQTFLYGCELEAGKDVIFNPEDEDFEHHLDLRMACVDPSTKDELHMVEVEGQDIEGQKIKAVLVSLKPSTLPSVCLGGFTISPPVVFRLKAGSGPVHLSGQHLVMGVDDSIEEEDDDGEEEEEDVKSSKKRPAFSPADKSKKKMKMDEDDDDEEDEEDEDDDEDDDEVEETPVKPEPKPKAAQNGKSPKPSTPRKNEVKTPKGKSPQTPKEPLTLPQIQEKIQEAVKKGVSLPKVRVKFDNFVKNSYKVADGTDLEDLWKWRQTVTEAK